VFCGTALLSLQSRCFFPASSLLFSQRYKQNSRAFKIENVSESRKELSKGTRQYCFEKKKACKIVEKKLENDTGISKTYRKRQLKLNVSDLESTFNASDKNC
jgi:hypothetical protein